MGNTFKVLCTVMPGRGKQARRLALQDCIRAWYKANGVKDKLFGIKPWGIQAPKRAPKLKSSAAACRALIPFAHEATQTYLDASSPTHAAIQLAAKALNECYDCLSTASHDWRARLPAAGRDFVIQLQALEQGAAHMDWRVKPKTHQFLELCYSGSKPNMSWTYRDEDYGGSIAQLCRIKGGCWKKVQTYSSKALFLFQTRNAFPRIL